MGGVVKLDRMVTEVDQIDAREISRESEQWRAAVYARLGTTSKTTTDIHTHQIQEFAEMKRRMRRMENQLRSLAYAPARRAVGAVATGNATTQRGSEVRHGTSEQGQDARPAQLVTNPKLLSVLWDERQNGVGGNLPAKLFTPAQRGAVRAKYSQRKVFWDCVERQIDNGCTASTAIARIERIYSGFRSITQKLIALRKDERTGGHNQLCPFSVDPERRGRRGQRLQQ